MDEQRSRQKRRFVAALLIYLAWVASLAALAVFSGHEPVPRPSAPEMR